MCQEAEGKSSEVLLDGAQDPLVSRAAEWSGEPGAWETIARTQAEEAQREGAQIVFLGDSITQGWATEGREMWDSRFASLGAVNMGIGGDRTQNLLWRIQRLGVLDGLTPALVVLKIGVNNLWMDVHTYGLARVAEGVACVAAAILEKCPDARLLVLGILPTQADPADPLRTILRDVNARSADTLPTFDGRVRFMDLGRNFLEADGTISWEIMPDACHLSPRGYQKFADALEPLIKECLTRTVLPAESHPLRLDITQVPFSRAGSYLALSLCDADDARPWEQRPGHVLLLRTLRGDRETERVFRLELLGLISGIPESLPFEVEAAANLLRLHTSGGMVEIVMTADQSVRFRGSGAVGLRLSLIHVRGYANAQPCDREGRWLVNAWTARMNYRLSPVRGRLQVDAPFETLHATHIVADFLPGSEAGFEGLLEEFLPEREPTTRSSFDQEAQEAAASFEEFRAGQPPVQSDLQATADLMAYVQWSALVAPDGHLSRPAMLMSKNHMASIWSWDHCFNALALMPHDPALAWNQFLLPFDHQDAAGALPDFVNDKVIIRNFTKPPIHGWTLRILLESDKTGFLSDARLAEAYGPLARWTEWWLARRDQDGDGVPQYDHGNDSGWDNCTAFDVGFPLEGPDLCAYLVLQMDALAEIAARLGWADEVSHWRKRADTLLDRLMAHSWRGDRFVAPRSGDHSLASTETDSLLTFLPLVLGPRLPAETRGPLVAGLLAPGRFLTEFGLATEAVSSTRYEPDGYWRGPIWGPPVLLIVDGLRRLGEVGAARDIAARFCRTVVLSGAAENFNALTGAGLRDRGYTWTASIFLILARDYLTS